MTVNVRHPKRRIVIVGTTVVAAAALTGGIAYAADAPGGSSGHYGRPGGYGAQEGPGGEHGLGGPQGGPGRAGFGPERGALHGTEVRGTNAAGTATETDVFQTGTVTAVTATSLAVKSTDGFTATYVLNSSTHLLSGIRGNGKTASATLAVGDKVSVLATSANGADTATEVHEAKAPAPSTSSGAKPPAPPTSASNS
jgi:hypothetical protein